MAKFSTFARSIVITASLVIISSLSIPCSTAQAVDTASISISPPRFELFGNPGDSLSEKIKVANPSNADVTYTIETEDFVASGDQGGVDFVDVNAPNNNFSLAKWITVEPTKFTVAAGADRLIDYTIRIPKGAEPGGHYASVLVKLAAAPVSDGASVQSKVGTLILLRVSGDIKENLTLSHFKTDNYYYKQGPVNFDLRTTNSGNVHVAPTGKIVITNMFNQKVKEISLNQANVLPGASRVVLTKWDDTKLLGKYTATLASTYGTQGQQLVTSCTFIVIPPLVIFIILGVLIIIFLAVTQRKGLKRFVNRLTSD